MAAVVFVDNHTNVMSHIHTLEINDIDLDYLKKNISSIWLPSIEDIFRVYKRYPYNLIYTNHNTFFFL